ncbi:MAG: hypothetical protein KC493_18040, partial [Bacteriovoracaceae bacterium]|nr:hypothetical protein [Bacteriovoracaceae bacterium]
MMKLFKNQSGVSLVEVMIAGGIGVGIFFFVQSSLVRVQKMQAKIERRAELYNVKESLRTWLTDMRAWEQNPESDIPKRDNLSAFYYYPSPRAEIKPLTMSLEEHNIIESKLKVSVKDRFKCPKGLEGCRVILFNYRGKMIDPENDVIPGSHFKIAIGFETPDEEISRAFIP